MWFPQDSVFIIMNNPNYVLESSCALTFITYNLWSSRVGCGGKLDSFTNMRWIYTNHYHFSSYYNKHVQLPKTDKSRNRCDEQFLASSRAGSERAGEGHVGTESQDTPAERQHNEDTAGDATH